jgi:hypothetical protein
MAQKKQFPSVISPNVRRNSIISMKGPQQYIFENDLHVVFEEADGSPNV